MSNKRKYAVFIKNYCIGKSSPVICLLELLSDMGEVDVFVQSTSHLTATVLTKPNVNLICLDRGKAAGIAHRIGLIWNDFCASLSLPRRNDLSYSKYHACIGLDPHGFLLCKEMFPSANSVYYYSLEIYLRTNHFNLLYPRKAMEKEHREITSIKGLLIQSIEREIIFREEYQLSVHIPTFILPVTYLEKSQKAKSNLLRSKFNIKPETKVALHLGAIREYFSCIELANAFSKIPKWVLIFHGHSSSRYVDTLKGVIDQNRLSNIFISGEPFELIEDMDPIVMSCDLGLAWYNNLSPNFTTSGKSSGKISAYLRFGLPVIANKYPSTVDAIEYTGCGVCVDDFDDIPDAVRKIEMNYQVYSDNCRKEYDKVYWFDNYRKGLTEFIDG